MIIGTVNAQYEITLRVPVINAQGQEHEVETLLDTGFNGSLTLPPTLIANLGLAWRSQATATLADGSRQQFDVYTGTVMWNGTPRQILVQAIDTDPLLGMLLLVGHDLRARVIVGGGAEIEPIP